MLQRSPLQQPVRDALPESNFMATVAGGGRPVALITLEKLWNDRGRAEAAGVHLRRRILWRIHHKTYRGCARGKINSCCAYAGDADGFRGVWGSLR
jgi:hypothetical protein